MFVSMQNRVLDARGEAHAINSQSESRLAKAIVAIQHQRTVARAAREAKNSSAYQAAVTRLKLLVRQQNACLSRLATLSQIMDTIDQVEFCIESAGLMRQTNRLIGMTNRRISIPGLIKIMRRASQANRSLHSAQLKLGDLANSFTDSLAEEVPDSAIEEMLSDQPLETDRVAQALREKKLEFTFPFKEGT